MRTALQALAHIVAALALASLFALALRDWHLNREAAGQCIEMTGGWTPACTVPVKAALSARW